MNVTRRQGCVGQTIVVVDTTTKRARFNVITFYVRVGFVLAHIGRDGLVSE